jgi:hypothetical protein
MGVRTRSGQRASITDQILVADSGRSSSKHSRISRLPDIEMVHEATLASPPDPHPELRPASRTSIAKRLDRCVPAVAARWAGGEKPAPLVLTASVAIRSLILISGQMPSQSTIPASGMSLQLRRPPPLTGSRVVVLAIRPRA